MVFSCQNNEDNLRFLLLAIVLTFYMLIGALLFQQLEGDKEISQAEIFWKTYHEFRQLYINVDSNSTNSSNIDLERLHELLYAYGNATVTGSLNHRKRWDFSGSFHFVGTIVSTIGYGNTTPQTTYGRVAVIFYGFFGCSGGILFFNLFLERIITFLAWIFRTIHLYRLKKRLKDPTCPNQANLPDILDDEVVIIQHQKPSVYSVMFSLTIATIIVACIASTLYTSYEQWTYFEGIYFCFVSFATIGFGDFVSTQHDDYPNTYRFCNFVFLVIGCCCLYSLLNVTSIVIKQTLNWLIQQMECRCSKSRNKNIVKRSYSATLHQPKNSKRKQSTVTSINLRYQESMSSRRRLSLPTDPQNNEIDSESDDEKGLSGNFCNVNDFLKTDKVSLAMMQKQLYETAQMQRGGCSIVASEHRTPILNHRATHVTSNNSNDFTLHCGPLAIASEKFNSSSPSK